MEGVILTPIIIAGNTMHNAVRFSAEDHKKANEVDKNHWAKPSKKASQCA